MKELIAIDTIDIVGYSVIDHLLWLRQSAKNYNKQDPKHIYSVIRNPLGKEHGYFLIRMVRTDNYQKEA